jgi:hypothetical protein
VGVGEGLQGCDVEAVRKKVVFGAHRLGRYFCDLEKTVWEREQPVSDPAREVHVQDQDRCCLVSKNGVLV